MCVCSSIRPPSHFPFLTIFPLFFSLFCFEWFILIAKSGASYNLVKVHKILYHIRISALKDCSPPESNAKHDTFDIDCGTAGREQPEKQQHRIHCNALSIDFDIYLWYFLLEYNCNVIRIIFGFAVSRHQASLFAVFWRNDFSLLGFLIARFSALIFMFYANMWRCDWYK